MRRGAPRPGYSGLGAAAAICYSIHGRRDSHRRGIRRVAGVGPGHQPGPGTACQPYRVAPRRPGRGAGTQDPLAYDSHRGGRSGSGIRHRPNHGGSLFCDRLLFPGRTAGHHRHLLPVHRRLHRPAQAAAEKQALLLSDRTFHRRVRYALPDEAQRRGAGQHLHSIYHGDGDDFGYPFPVPGYR